MTKRFTTSVHTPHGPSAISAWWRRNKATASEPDHEVKQRRLFIHNRQAVG